MAPPCPDPPAPLGFFAGAAWGSLGGLALVLIILVKVSLPQAKIQFPSDPAEGVWWVATISLVTLGAIGGGTASSGNPCLGIGSVITAGFVTPFVLSALFSEYQKLKGPLVPEKSKEPAER